MTISAQRKGKTAKNWTTADETVVVFGWEKNGTVQIRFEMDSKGGGVTESKLEFTKESFSELAFAMMRANREAAFSAFGEALQWKPRHLRAN